jgi:hypothetical protein
MTLPVYARGRASGNSGPTDVRARAAPVETDERLADTVKARLDRVEAFVAAVLEAVDAPDDVADAVAEQLGDDRDAGDVRGEDAENDGDEDAAAHGASEPAGMSLCSSLRAAPIALLLVLQPRDLGVDLAPRAGRARSAAR